MRLDEVKFCSNSVNKRENVCLQMVLSHVTHLFVNHLICIWEQAAKSIHQGRNSTAVGTRFRSATPSTFLKCRKTLHSLCLIKATESELLAVQFS